MIDIFRKKLENIENIFSLKKKTRMMYQLLSQEVVAERSLVEVEVGGAQQEENSMELAENWN